MKKIFSLLFMMAALSSIADEPANYVYMTPNQKNWAGYVDLNYLFWKPYSDSLDFGVTYLDYIFAAVNTHKNNLDVKHADFPWESGARLACGVSSQSWDLIASWTYFFSDGKREAFAQNYTPLMADGIQAVRLFQIWGSGSQDQSYSCDSLSAHYRILLSNFDLDIGKSFPLSSHWLIRPSFGAKGAYLQQRMNTKASLGLDTTFARTHITNRYLAAGPRIAAETRFLFNNHFFLFVKGAASLLDGRYLLRILSYFTLPVVPPNTIRSENRFDKNAVRTCYELSLGGEVSWQLNRDRAALLLGASYELQLWPEQFALPQLYNSIDYVRQAGDVSFHGLVLNMSFVY